MTLVAGEYGNKAIRINTRYDLAGNAGLRLVVLRPDGTGFEVTDPDVYVGNADVSDGLVSLLANHYAVYLLQAADVTMPGRYLFQLTVSGVAGQVISVEKAVEVQRRLSVPV